MAQIDLDTLPRTMKEAQALGSKHYFTGKLCKRGHLAHRFTSTRQCNDCQLVHLSQVPAKRRKEINQAYQLTGKPAAYRAKTKDKAAARIAAFKLANPGYASAYQAKRCAEDPIFLARKNLRNRLRKFVLGQKRGSIGTVIGCDWNQLVAHLESQFKPGMGWENYSIRGWHIDHIRPCASFDLTDPEQQKECFHYSNLQPLWAEENLKKGARLAA
jgi:hypothetical protein